MAIFVLLLFVVFLLLLICPEGICKFLVEKVNLLYFLVY